MSGATPTAQTLVAQPFAMWDRTNGVWETGQLDLYGQPAPYSETWPTSGWMHNRSAYRRPLSALLTPVVF